MYKSILVRFDAATAERTGNDNRLQAFNHPLGKDTRTPVQSSFQDFTWKTAFPENRTTPL
jgi:hypothetical protein